jgi:hypothetical protein
MKAVGGGGGRGRVGGFVPRVAILAAFTESFNCFLFLGDEREATRLLWAFCVLIAPKKAGGAQSGQNPLVSQ